MCERRYLAAAAESSGVKKHTITLVAFGGGETKRLRKSSFSPGQNAAAWQSIPRIDFLSSGVACSKAQPRHLGGLAGDADDGAFDHKGRQSFLRFV